MSSESVMLSNCLILCHPLLLLPSIFPSIKVFSNESSLHIGHRSIGASASVLPMNSQSLFPLGLTGLNSLLSKGPTRVYPAPQFESISSSALSLLYYPTLTSSDITLPTKVHLIKTMVFPVVTYGCESWTIKKAEHQRIDAFELWCWSRLLRVPWTERRSNQSILKEISPEYSLEGLMLS